MSEKEIKKLDEKGEEKISGGTKISDKVKEVLIKKGIGITEPAKKTMPPMVMYGVMKPSEDSIRLLKEKREQIEKTKDPKDALAPSEPQIEEKK